MEKFLDFLKRNKAKILVIAGLIGVLVAEGATQKPVIELLGALLDLI